MIFERPMDDMPAIAKTSTKLMWCCNIRRWTLMVSFFNIVVSTFDMLQIVFLFYTMWDELEADTTVITSEYLHLDNTLIVIVGLFSYVGIIQINIFYIIDVYKLNVDFIRMLYLYSLVRTLSLFYFTLGVLYPILILSFRRRRVIQQVVTLTFECLLIVSFVFYGSMESHNAGDPGGKRSGPAVVVELRTGTQTM